MEHDQRRNRQELKRLLDTNSVVRRMPAHMRHGVSVNGSAHIRR